MKLILTLTAAIALSATSFAQSANPFSMSSKDADKPIGISADTILADVKNQTATYSGNVVVSQGELRLRSDALSIQASKGEIRRIQAKGSVVLASAQGQATGALADYDVTGRMVTMTGKVVLSQGQNVMRGSRLVINLATGQAQLSSSPGVTGSGRVEGLFVPAKKDPPKPKPAATPAAAPAPASPSGTP
jgi:lipopolysaccharide export system protein LptA